jgi:hypothetical protein
MNLWHVIFGTVEPQTDFMPGSPDGLRRFLWFVRNPFPLLSGNVIGINDLQYVTNGKTVSVKDPHGLSWATQGGFNRLTHIVTSPGPRNGHVFEYVSYRGRFIEGYAGWRPSGSFGLALRHSGAKGF